MPKEFPKTFMVETYTDRRGSMNILQENSNHQTKIVKMTDSKKGVLRGFHYQLPPYLQRKKIFLLNGEIQDVLLEVSELGVPTGEVIENILSSKEGLVGLSIPSNWAHAYLTLSERSSVLYVCDQLYGEEISLNPLKNYSKWLISSEKIIISDRDMK